MPASNSSLAALLEYATDAERVYINATLEHGTERKAARALKRAPSVVHRAIARAKRRAASRGYAPEHGWNPPAARTAPAGTLPEGMRLRGVSDHVDADGNRDHAWVKSERDSDPDAHAPLPPDFLVRRVAEFTDSQGDIRARWTSYAPAEVDRWELMVKAAREACEGLPAAVPAPAPADVEDDLLALYGYGDPHIGMLAWGHETGEDFDLSIARTTIDAVTTRLVDAAPRAATALLVLAGDNFHADDDRQITPAHGHKLDVDTRAAKVFRVGVELWISAVRAALRKHAAAQVMILRGNHDPLTAFMLAEVLRAYFRDDPRVEVLDNVREHNYLLFGRVLLGMTHGHKSRPDALAGVMAADVPDLWAKATAERHWITGHIHSKTWWDLRGCSLETLRTLAPEDAHARGAGYRSRRGAIVVTYHAEYGEIGRATVTPARAGVQR